MNKKTIITSVSAVCVSVLAVAGVAYAASIDATSKLGGSSGDFFNFDGTGVFGSVKIGKQGSGGVTFFNGTIVNETTNNGSDNPVTFGDNVRIDGRVWRGATSGSGDGMPFIVKDDLEVEGDISWQTKTSYISVPGSAFIATDPSNVDATINILVSPDAGGTGFYAPAQLPHGATIKSMKAVMIDNNGSASMTVDLFKIPNAAGQTSIEISSGSHEISSVTSTTNSANTQVFKDTTVLNPVVDNDNYTYTLRASYGDNSNLDLYSVIIEYEFNTPY